MPRRTSYWNIGDRKGPHSGAETTQTKEALQNFRRRAHLNSESFLVKLASV